MLKKLFKKTIVGILTWESKKVLEKYNPKIVAVTGSVGKTSTKDAIFAVLSKFYYVRKSEKSFNSEIGIPLTILGCPNGWSNPVIWVSNIFTGLSLIFFTNKYPEWLVLEVGADRPGDIKSVAKWLKPDISVITKLSKVPVHVEYFDSPEAVIAEKSHLAYAVKSDGYLVLNGDDEDVYDMRGKSKTRVASYGFNDGLNLVASHETIMYEEKDGASAPTGITFRVQCDGSSLPVRIMGTIGKNHVYSALAALAVGHVNGLNLIKMIESLSEHETPPGRLRVISGIKGSTIIDDTYNSSPVACEAAINALNDINVNGRKIAVLGDMLELGKFSTDEHTKIGRLAGSVCDILITVGIRARHFAEGAMIAGMSEKNIYQYESSKEAGKFLEQILQKGDVVLIKGSQGTRMERAVEEVMEHPEDKEKLLVRQDPAWQTR